MGWIEIQYNSKQESEWSIMEGKLQVLFNDEVVDSNGYSGLTNSFEIFDENFYLGGTASNTFELNLNKEYVEVVPASIIINYEDNVFATLVLDKIEEISKYENSYSLTDKMVNFEFNYDASQIFVDGKTTLKEILLDICSKANVELATTEFYGQDMEISWYDNAITARQYIGYIAELNGGFARINREGKLEIVPFKSESKATISLDELEDFTIGEYHKITRVVFDNGLLVHSFGDETGNTLYLNTDNVFINDKETIEAIYNSIVGFEFYSFEAINGPIKNVLAGDIITFTDGENNYPTIAQYQTDFFGDWAGDYSLKIKSLKQEETEVKGWQESYKRLKITQDRANGEIKILSSTTENIQQQVNENEEKMNNNYYTKTSTEELIANSSTGLTNTFSEAGGNNIFRNTNFSAQEVLEEGQYYEFWYGNTTRQTNNNSANGYSILLQKDNLNQEQIVANGNYTISFMYKKLNPLATILIKINGTAYELTEDSFTLFQTGIKDEDGNYIVNPIIVTDNHIKIEFDCDINNACEIYDIMCNAGTVKLAYSQNANETATDTVNISKGITITSSESDVKFVANNVGIRTLPKSSDGREEDIITKFTDKGMKTKEAEIENEAIIVGILRQKVGDQIWDSLI